MEARSGLCPECLETSLSALECLSVSGGGILETVGECSCVCGLKVLRSLPEVMSSLRCGRGTHVCTGMSPTLCDCLGLCALESVVPLTPSGGDSAKSWVLSPGEAISWHTHCLGLNF